MSRKYPTPKDQEKALDEMRRILNRDLSVLLSDESAENATPEVLERAILFEGILSMFDILEGKVTAGVLLASKITHYNEGAMELGPMDPHIVEQAETCLLLMVGEEE